MVNKKTGIIAVITIFLVIIVTILVNGAGKSSENFQKSTMNSSIKNVSCGSCDDFNGNSMNHTSKTVYSVENYNNTSSSSCCQ